MINNIDVIVVFFNDEKLVSSFFENIINIKKYNFKFHFVDNNSNDNTYIELNKIKKNHKNVNIYKNNNYCFSKSKNICLEKIDYQNSDFILFISPDFFISENNLSKLVESLNKDLMYVGFDASNIFDETEIEYCFEGILNLEQYLKDTCSLVCSNLIEKFNIRFDEYYTPFFLEDADFSLSIGKYTKIKKLKLTSKINSIKHKKISKKLYNQIKQINLNYLIYKFDLKNNKILEIPYLNKKNYNELTKSCSNYVDFYENIFTKEFLEKVKKCLFKLDPNKKNVLTVANSIFPPAGGGENWLLDTCNFLDNYNHICLCFEDVANEKKFNHTNIVEYNKFQIIQTSFDLCKIFYLQNIFNFDFVLHQGSFRYDIAKICSILKLKMISCFCFWNGLIEQTDDGDLININMENRKYNPHHLFLEKWDFVKFYCPSEFVSQISEYNCNKKIPIIENISIINCKKIIPNQGKYVTLFNTHPLKGGMELLFLLKNLDIKIPIMAVITEKWFNFEEKIKKEFELRNKKNNINVLFFEKQLNIEDLYNKSKVILIPSLVDETFCRVCYESVILNKKIVSYDSGNIKNILKNYTNSIIINKNLNKNLTNYQDISINLETLISWKNSVEKLYHQANNEFINYKKINKDAQSIKNKFEKLIKS